VAEEGDNIAPLSDIGIHNTSPDDDYNLLDEIEPMRQAHLIADPNDVTKKRPVVSSSKRPSRTLYDDGVYRWE
jgi:hypothetical protein